MYIISVIPLIKIPHPNPQLLSYFCAEKIKIGGLVKIPLRNKKINAIVVEQKKVEEQKFRLKKLADYTIKPIDKILSSEPVLTDKQLKLLFWFADYYFAPLGMVAKIFLSANSRIKKTRSQKSRIPALGGSASGGKIQNLILTPATKSLVFAPFTNLKSIIIEDESSDLYKSWGRRPHYNARDIALELAKIHKAKLTLRSSLPSVETCYWAEQKKYKLTIQNQKSRAKNQKLIDMREEMRKGNFSIISKGLEEKLRNSKKAILYIARRGTSTFILCRECGYVSMCKDCELPMVFHEDKPSRRLVCHHCGKDDIAPVLCPNCKSAKIKYFGAGTQKVESEVKKLFLEKTALRLDSDIAEKSAQQEKILKYYKEGKNVILVGSQMLLNKNLKSDLAAIISIETILNLPDFKSQERVFQIINQMQKKAEKEFFLQTYNPENFTLKTALENNFEKFYNEEIKNRKAFNYPPFSQIIKLTYGHKNPLQAKNQARILDEKLKTRIRQLAITNEQLAMLGPIPAFVLKEKNRYYWNIVLKSRIEDLNLRNKLLIIVPSDWEIEVDPETLL